MVLTNCITVYITSLCIFNFYCWYVSSFIISNSIVDSFRQNVCFNSTQEHYACLLFTHVLDQWNCFKTYITCNSSNLVQEHECSLQYLLTSIQKKNAILQVHMLVIYSHFSTLTLQWPRYFYSRWCPRGVPSYGPNRRKPLSQPNFAMKFAQYMYGL